MCEFCVQHGEGKRWYLQAKNYSRELYEKHLAAQKQTGEEEYREGDNERNSALGMAAGDRHRVSHPVEAKAEYEAGFATWLRERKEEHWGQVVPLEEIEQILDMEGTNMVRVPCSCRSLTRGVYDARYCLLLTPSAVTKKGASRELDPPDWSSDMDTLNPDGAKKMMQGLDRLGLVHTVWTMHTPYIGVICNCDTNDCLGMRSAVRRGERRQFFKAEWIAAIDFESCIGCRDCKKLCQFGAISHSSVANKCYIDPFECYGCGLCRTVCPQDAITLKDRNEMPVLANDW